MDPFSTAAGIIAVIQIADMVVSLCKCYLEAANDAPSDLRLILVETSTMKTVLESLSFLCSRDIKEIRNDMLHLRTALTESQEREFYNWLRRTDPCKLHHQACIRYESGTGDWVLRSDEWQNWQAGRHRCLWVHGIPGAGKTILASHIAKALDEQCRRATTKMTSVYYYCNFSNNQDESVPFLRWTIDQLCRKADMIPDCLYDLFRVGVEPSLPMLLQAFAAILQGFDSVYIVLDALDESTPSGELLHVVQHLVTDSRLEKVHLFATSRQYVHIEDVMRPISTPVSMQNPLLDEDIRLFVQARFRENKWLKVWPPDVQQETVETLSAKAKGMFRWVVCQIEVLQRLTPNRAIILKALDTLPRTLDETYERVLLGIPEEARRFVHTAIKLIHGHRSVHCKNPASYILLDMIRRSVASSPPEIDYRYDEDLLREFCGCLISVGHESRSEGVCSGGDKGPLTWTITTASFAHYTVCEFLESRRIQEGPARFFAVDKNAAELEYSNLIVTAALGVRSISPDCIREDPSFKEGCLLAQVGFSEEYGFDFLPEDHFPDFFAEDRFFDFLAEDCFLEGGSRLVQLMLDGDPDFYYIFSSALHAPKVASGRKDLEPNDPGDPRTLLLHLLDTARLHYPILRRVAAWTHSQAPYLQYYYEDYSCPMFWISEEDKDAMREFLHNMPRGLTN
ncbi:Vegetative incompatibility protein HET-E-1 [Madurella mycetomatis]|uniref:Vegetative incompatibility protein HET-E-1 n=1 Tax=Madurella mycetomatis TaxID=100816 RepID=A0A175VYX4_9PEZI|nr:Vegetative incompatibility protein HET-E-1 [Madurella mycetomatis]